MTGYELRLWRKGQENWVQERAAEELGVSLRTYKSYEKLDEVPKLVELATKALSLRQIYPRIVDEPTIAPKLLMTLV